MGRRAITPYYPTAHGPPAALVQVRRSLQRSRRLWRWPTTSAHQPAKAAVVGKTAVLPGPEGPLRRHLTTNAPLCLHGTLSTAATLQRVNTALTLRATTIGGGLLLGFGVALASLLILTTPFTGCTEVGVPADVHTGFEFVGVEDSALVYSPDGVNVCESPLWVAVLPLVPGICGLLLLAYGRRSPPGRDNIRWQGRSAD